MNPLHLIALGGMLMLTGLLAAAVALRPAPPRLGVVLEQLNATTTFTASPGADTVPGSPPWWAPPWATRLALAHLGARDEDLRILDMNRPVLAVRKIGWFLAGAAVPPVLNTLLLATGAPVPWLFPGLASVALAVAAWMIPSRRVAERAESARVEFCAALAAFLTLVGLERKARGSPIEALEEASRVSGFWPFAMIHAEVIKAERTNQLPWTALRQLGVVIAVEELVNLANIVASADEGAAIFDTLIAEARNLENAQMEEQRRLAGIGSEKLTFPMMMFGLGTIVLLAYPAFARL